MPASRGEPLTEVLAINIVFPSRFYLQEPGMIKVSNPRCPHSGN
uniref:Uncharacterized protein n=1 Tax=Rhizophora mucronata TaxID=61149 RepID=A0A2P2QB21_RHIMU